MGGTGRGGKGVDSLKEKEELVIGDGLAVLDGVAGAELVESIVRIELGELGVALFHLQEHHLPAIQTCNNRP